MSAPLDNQFALKFKTSEERKDLCKKYCEHIEKGYSDESFPECDIDTLKKYMAEYPDDFQVFGADVDRSKRIRRMFWEKIGILGTVGKLKGFSAKSWEFNMANRFGWRMRNDVTTENQKFETPIIYLPVERD